MRRRREAGLGSRCNTVVWPMLACLLALMAAGPVSAQASHSPLLEPSALAYDAAGDLFIADAKRHQVFEATLAGTLVVVAGSGTQGFAGDGGQAAAAELNSPQGLAIGSDGTLYIADTGNARIRAVHAGVMTTFAGSGIVGFHGEGISASVAAFRQPTALAFDASGGLLVCDTGNHRVRRIDSGVVRTIAGSGIQGFAGDGGTASTAELDSPSGIAVGTDGRVFVADTHNQRIRVVAADGTISTIAGNGQRGYFGDGGSALAARLSGPRGLAIGPGGMLLIADSDNERLRAVDASGVITTLAGAGTEGASSDGASEASAALHAPRATAVSPFGMPALLDALNGAVRVLTPAGTLYQPAALAAGRTSIVGVSTTPSQAYGQATAVIAVSGAVGVPYGAVTISDGGATLATATLAKGTATISLPALNAGDHTLTVTYGGDGLNPSATADNVAVTVSKTEVIATANRASMVYGSTVPAFSGSVAGILPQDAGQVSAIFSSSAGSVSDVGTYPITAALTGAASGNYTVTMGAGSGSLQITQAGSVTALGTPAPSYAGLPLRLAATVVSSTSGAPEGTVQFFDGATPIGTGTLVNGSASAVYLSPPAGTLNLSARYSGDLDFAPSASASQTALVGALPDFGLSVSGAGAATVAAGNSAAFSVVVQAQPAPFTGDVTFSAAGLPPGATATFSPSQIVPGAGAATVTVTVVTAAAVAGAPSLLSGGPWTLAGLVFCGSLLAKGRRRAFLLLGIPVLLSGCGARNVGEPAGGLTSHTYALQITGTSTNLLGATVVHTTSLSLTVQE